MNTSVRNEPEMVTARERRSGQTARLRALTGRVMRDVPFYRERLRAAGISADSPVTPDDLAALPFTTADDLRDHYPFGLLAVPLRDVVRLHASSGTTGKPKVSAYTQNDIDMWSGLMARTMAAASVTADDIVHNAYGYGLFTGGLGFHYGAERLGAMVVPVSAGNTRRQLMLMQDFGSTVLCSTPSYSLLLAEVAREEGIDTGSLRLRVGLFGAEPWSEDMRAEIEARLGLSAVNVYGLSEVIGPGVAVECAEKNGMHIFEDHFLPEIIDPETGAVLEQGEAGELVLTSLTREAMPLLRYRTRDRTRLLGEPCKCGRTTVRMERVMGRTDDMLIVRGVNVFPSQIESVLLQAGEIEPHYLILVDRSASHLDELEVQVEACAEVHQHSSRRQRLQQRLERDLLGVLGISCRVSLVGPGALKRSEGKAARIADRRSL